MRIGRVIFATLIALSVAILPTARGAAFAPKSVAASASESMTDCCEHQGTPCDKTDKATNDCASMAACAIKCFNFVSFDLSGFAVAHFPGGHRAVASEQHGPAADGKPPFHPPRA